MNMLTLNPHPVQTMSSLELVEFINLQRKEDEAALTHANFLAKVQKVLGDGSHSFECDLPDSYGRPRKGYVFPKREACLMAMSYSYELQAAVFDKMTALEAQAMQTIALPNFTDPAEAAVAWAAEFKAKQLAQVQVTQLETKVTEMTVDVQAFNQLTKADGSLCVTDAAKALGKGQKELHKWLSAHDWIYKRTGCAHWLGYSDKEKSGYVEHKVTEVSRPDGTTKITEQVRITPKGLTKLAKIFATGDAA